jgi:glycosyltransferase involved in cell wall biosynthesis
MSKVKSVLFVTYHFPPEVGGIQTRISRYMSNLRAKGKRVGVIFLTSVRSGRIANTYSNLKLIVGMSARNRVDAIHVFSGGTTFMAVFSLLIARVMGVAAVFSFFGIEGVVFGSFSERARFVISGTLATAIATNSSAMKAFVPSRFRSKTRTILGGSDYSSSPVEPLSTDDLPVVLSVGRLVRSKGFDDILQAFSVVKQSVPNAKLVIVGDGLESKNLKDLAASLGLSDSVEFKGILRGERLQTEYQRSSVFVLASKQVDDDPATEAFGLVLVEAAMHGKPLVATRIGGIPEIVRDGVNGVLVPQNNPRELGLAITRLLSDKELRQKLGENSLKIARSEFTWDASTERLLNCYEKQD